MNSQWYFVVLVTVAIAISYFDRQTLPVAIAAIQHNIPLSDQQFSYLQTAFLLSYAALYVIGGRLLDMLGTRRGFMLIMLWWSLACASARARRRTSALLLGARFLLGMGEGGAFPPRPAWSPSGFRCEQRSTAMGIINAGTAVGSVLAPPLIGIVLLHQRLAHGVLRLRRASASLGCSGGRCRYRRHRRCLHRHARRPRSSRSQLSLARTHRHAQRPGASSSPSS